MDDHMTYIPPTTETETATTLATISTTMAAVLEQVKHLEPIATEARRVRILMDEGTDSDPMFYDSRDEEEQI